MDSLPAIDSPRATPHVFLVEHYWPEATPDAFQATTARVRAAVNEMAGAGAPLRLLHSTFIPEDGSALCLFSSPVPGLVEEAYRRAGVAFDRLLNAVDIDSREDGAPATTPET